MGDSWKEILNRNRFTLVTDLDTENVALLDLLIQLNVITPTHRKKWKGLNGIDKSSELVDHLARSTHDCYTRFLQALKGTGQMGLVELLTTDNTKDMTSMETAHYATKTPVQESLAFTGPQSGRPQQGWPIIAASALSKKRRIGQGSFGTVYKATHNRLGCVAVKDIFTPRMKWDSYKVTGEAAMWPHLHHDNVLIFYGTMMAEEDEEEDSSSSDDELDCVEVSIVTELMELGSLCGILQNCWNKNYKITPAFAIFICREICSGMSYLHTRTPMVLHQDLRTENILVNAHFGIKVADFGLVEMKSKPTDYSMHSRVGNLCYRAPEFLHNRKTPPTRELDVYAFGIVAWVIAASGDMPYKGLGDAEIITGVANAEQPLRPSLSTIPDESPQLLENIMQLAWVPASHHRPHFSNLLRDFDDYISERCEFDSQIQHSKNELLHLLNTKQGKQTGPDIPDRRKQQQQEQQRHPPALVEPLVPFPGPSATNFVTGQQPSDEAAILEINISQVDETDETVKQLIKDHKHVYKMTAVPRGRVVIINNEKFTKDVHDETSKMLSNRYGSQYDCVNLKNVFKKLHFEVEEWPNCTAADIRSKLEEESRRITHKAADAFVLIILSHGIKDHVYGADGRTVHIENHIIKPFHGDSCPKLVGKPKLFFIQACQGEKRVQTVLADGDDATNNAFCFSLDTVVVQADPQADILVTLSTVPGRVSFRDTERGTWFIRDLVQVLSTHAHKDDLLNMLTKVNQRVNERRGRLGYIQLPQQKGQLLKQVYFFPGYPSRLDASP